MSTKGIEMPNELELYPHNEKAYRKLLDMLSETRRACIIHPTGTGNFEPLVIDLVDNFEMIGIEQIVSMMSESYARLSGENDLEELIPPSAFKVIDHENDARHLAKNLERRLALRSEKLTIDEKIALWKGL